jgi:hypothetical protein
MKDMLPIGISMLSLVIASITAWLTLRRGTVRMTRPTLVFFGPDGPGGPPKVFLRTLLYSTGKRGRIIENMFIRVRRGESLQTFNVWIYGDGPVARGSGLYVGDGGVAANHHFLLPRDETSFGFIGGTYRLEVFAALVGDRRTMSLAKIQLILAEPHAEAMRSRHAGVFYDWDPDSREYLASLDERSSLPSAGSSNTALQRAAHGAAAER